MPVPRRYHSPRRTQDAAETRRAILAAATELFASDGYARVTVADIAKRAEVAVPTVYASTGGKGDILRILIADAVASAGAADTVMALRATTTLREAMAVLAHGTRLGNEKQAVATDILMAARKADADAEKAWDEGVANYRGALREVAELLHSRELLAPGLTVEVTADLLWFSLGIGAWRALVHESGWSWDDAEAWLARHGESVLRTPLDRQSL